MKEGSFQTCCCSHVSTKCDMFSVILLQLDTIGLICSLEICVFSLGSEVWVSLVLLGVYRIQTILVLKIC